MKTVEYNGLNYDISNTNYNCLVNYILDNDRSESIGTLIHNYKISELRELVKYLNLDVKATNKDILCDLIVTAINDSSNTKVQLIRSDYLTIEKKDNNKVSADLSIDDTINNFSTFIDSFDMFGLDTSIIDVSDITTNPVTVTQQEAKTTSTTKVVNNPITTNITTSNITSVSITNKNISYEQLESFYNKGFVCLNNNSHITGIDARIMLSKLWERYPVIQKYLTDYEDHTSLLKVQFGFSKEVIEAKKIISKGHNSAPDKVEYGKEVNRTIYVQNDRGNDLGLPSEKRSPYKSGLKHGIIDHNVATSIYIDDQLIYSVNGSSVTKLQSQAYTNSGKSREHKVDSAYIGQSKNTKNKRNTGVKMTSSVQKGINTNLMGNLFKLPGQDRPMQVEINNRGILYLNQYMPNGTKVTTCIGQIIGKDDNFGTFKVDYSTGYKLHDNYVINRHIQQLISKALHHDISFMKTQPTVIEPIKKLSKCRRKAIARQQSNTIKIKITSDTNLVSLVKK